MSSKLEDAFVADHRTLTRGLARLLELVRSRELARATDVARALDADAGPHIEFEERIFYPEVRKSRGDDYVDALYDEHLAGLAAVRFLANLAPGSVPTNDEMETVQNDLEIAHEHAVSCGTLLSHVTSLPDAEQDELAAELERYRSVGHKWSELHPRPDDD